MARSLIRPVCFGRPVFASQNRVCASSAFSWRPANRSTSRELSIGRCQIVWTFPRSSEQSIIWRPLESCDGCIWAGPQRTTKPEAPLATTITSPAMSAGGWPLCRMAVPSGNSKSCWPRKPALLKSAILWNFLASVPPVLAGSRPRPVAKASPQPQKALPLLETLNHFPPIEPTRSFFLHTRNPRRNPPRTNGRRDG